MAKKTKKAGKAKISHDELKDRLKFYLGIAEKLARLTPTDVDDKIVVVLENLADQDWFIDLLLIILGKFGQSKKISKAEFLAAING